jgi:hypothetical protein
MRSNKWTFNLGHGLMIMTSPCPHKQRNENLVGLFYEVRAQSSIYTKINFLDLVSIERPFYCFTIPPKSVGYSELQNALTSTHTDYRMCTCCSCKLTASDLSANAN